MSYKCMHSSGRWHSSVCIVVVDGIVVVDDIVVVDVIVVYA